MLLFYEEERRPRGDEIGDHAGDVLSALVLVWIVLALWIGREFQRRMARGGAWQPVAEVLLAARSGPREVPIIRGTYSPLWR